MMAASSTATLEIARLSPSHFSGLMELFQALDESGESAWFRPHPFSEAQLASLCEPARRDLHYVLASQSSALGYGLLRGWDEGFETPSLGIAVHPRCRGFGLGQAFMHFLHCAARIRGATKVRLRVHAGNDVAVSLYRAMGYAFADSESDTRPGGFLIAYKELTK